MVAIMKSSEPLPNDCLCLEKVRNVESINIKLSQMATDKEKFLLLETNN